MTPAALFCLCHWGGRGGRVGGWRWWVEEVEAESTWSENLRSSAAPPSGRKREGGLESGVDEGEKGGVLGLVEKYLHVPV